MEIEFAFLAADNGNAELVEKLELMHEQEVKIATRKRENKKPSKTAVEKQKNAEKVIAFFETQEVGKAFTLTQIAEAIELENATPQRISPIVRLAAELYDLETDKVDKKIAYKRKA